MGLLYGAGRASVRDQINDCTSASGACREVTTVVIILLVLKSVRRLYVLMSDYTLVPRSVKRLYVLMSDYTLVCIVKRLYVLISD